MPKLHLPLDLDVNKPHPARFSHARRGIRVPFPRHMRFALQLEISTTPPARLGVFVDDTTGS